MVSYGGYIAILSILLVYFFPIIWQEKFKKNKLKSNEKNPFLNNYKIVNSYLKVLRDSPSNEIAGDINSLTHSKEEIKKAFSEFITFKKRSISLNDAELANYKSAYLVIDRFITKEEALIINQYHSRLLNKSEKGYDNEKHLYYLFLSRVQLSELKNDIEFNSF
jgi:hypothetical protein